MLIRRSMLIMSALFFWVMLVGMGKTPGPEVPTPEIDFKATVRDDQDITTRLSHASWEGNIFFTGTRGKGTVTISFEKIKKVTATGSGTNNKKDFQITLKNGDVVAVSFDSDERFLGMTNFGTYRIMATNIKEIVFE
ncbi:MAG: hypothetical protein HYS21_03430 [Deltaproteobacteria bacterium]|nr:hypothetical protein [Deltaproteobacteria bacterium]